MKYILKRAAITAWATASIIAFGLAFSVNPNTMSEGVAKILIVTAVITFTGVIVLIWGLTRSVKP